jgi:hypothetical protein
MFGMVTADRTEAGARVSIATAMIFLHNIG